MKLQHTFSIYPALGLALALSATAAMASENKTGTNPIDFSRDFRVYSEFTSLNTEGDGIQ